MKRLYIITMILLLNIGNSFCDNTIPLIKLKEYVEHSRNILKNNNISLTYNVSRIQEPLNLTEDDVRFQNLLFHKNSISTSLTPVNLLTKELISELNSKNKILLLNDIKYGVHQDFTHKIVSIDGDITYTTKENKTGYLKNHTVYFSNGLSTTTTYNDGKEFNSNTNSKEFNATFLMFNEILNNDDLINFETSLFGGNIYSYNYHYINDDSIPSKYGELVINKNKDNKYYPIKYVIINKNDKVTFHYEEYVEYQDLYIPSLIIKEVGAVNLANEKYIPYQVIHSLQK